MTRIGGPEVVPTPCPDCDPHGFDRNLEAFYGPPMEIGGVKLYADERVSRTGLCESRMVDAKSFARSYCPRHGAG